MLVHHQTFYQLYSTLLSPPILSKSIIILQIRREGLSFKKSPRNKLHGKNMFSYFFRRVIEATLNAMDHHVSEAQVNTIYH